MVLDLKIVTLPWKDQCNNVSPKHSKALSDSKQKSNEADGEL